MRKAHWAIWCSLNNEALAGKPELLNEDPYGAGWLFRLEAGASADTASLMSAKAYETFLAEESK
jgi:glycine cleavage system H protein